MTKLDELMSFIYSDELKEVRNFNCYDELIKKGKELQKEQPEYQKELLKKFIPFLYHYRVELNKHRTNDEIAQLFIDSIS